MAGSDQSEVMKHPGAMEYHEYHETWMGLSTLDLSGGYEL
jgi:hypothetical protein